MGHSSGRGWLGTTRQCRRRQHYRRAWHPDRAIWSRRHSHLQGMAHRRRARAALRSHYRGAGGGIYNRQIVWLTMSETGTEIATAARASALDRRTLWAGGGALIIVIAASFGWRSSLVPEPLMEMLTYASSPVLLDGALTAVGIAGLRMMGGVTLRLGVGLIRRSP